MSLHIEQQGNPDAQPLVLLHGWGMSSDIWASWLPSLEQDYQLLLVDLPGLGRSRFDSDRPYSLDALVEQIIGAITPMLTQPAIWLGWSLGGVVVARIADRCPEQVAGLITISTTPCFVQRSDWSDAMPLETFEVFQHSLAQHPIKTLNRFAMLQGQDDPQARSLLRTLKTVIAADSEQPLRLAESLALLAEDYRPLFTGLSVPRLFLFAENDALVPQAVASQPLLAQHAQKIEQAGHVPFISAEPAVTKAVNEWVKALIHD